MKHFISNNWFKILIGTSTLIFSVGFLIRSINPSYASNPNSSSNVVSTNGYAEGNYVYFISNGYMYQIQKGDLHMAFEYYNCWKYDTYRLDETANVIMSQSGTTTSSFWSNYKAGFLKDPITKIRRKSHFKYTKIE